jgi:iron only hydrogenase large subunit-like protein
MANKCVDCGECYKACPVSAIGVEQDDLELIFKYKTRVILIPGILIGQFSHKIPVASIYKALGEIGFTHVYHVENTVDMVLDAYAEYAASTDIRPLISSFCPAIVRLIQVRFPSLVNNIVRVNPPLDMTAAYYREKMKAEGFPENETGIFYATPCAAKIATVKSAAGKTSQTVTGVINMDFLYNKIQKIIQRHETESATMPVTDDLLTSRGMLWSLTRGEADHSKKRALAIDGIRNVTEMLEKVENDTLGSADFLELRACDEGCAGGILMTGNRFLTVERLRKMASEKILAGDERKLFDDGFRRLKEHSFLQNIRPGNIEKLDEDLSEAMKKMERKRRMMCFLPGFDCAACGAPDCETLSEDIVQGTANISDCIFMQQLMMKNRQISFEKAFSITGKIWGAGRLEKNCNKPGAENENN